MAALNEAYDCTINKAPIKFDKEFVDSRDDSYCITPKNIDYNPQVVANEYAKNECHSKFTRTPLQVKTCIKPADWGTFNKVQPGPIKPLEKFPNGMRNADYLKYLAENATHDYYQFFPNNEKCRKFPPQRLFNNLTRRSTLMNPHFAHDIAPQYLA